MAHSCNRSFRNIQISIWVCLLCISRTKFLNFFIHFVLQNVGINIHRNTDTGMPHQFLHHFRLHFLLKTSGCESMSYRMWVEVTNDLRLSVFLNRKYSFFLPHPLYHFLNFLFHDISAARTSHTCCEYQVSQFFFPSPPVSQLLFQSYLFFTLRF